MRSKHPIRILIEVLLVLVLAGGVVRIYFFAQHKKHPEQDEEMREVSRVIQDRVERDSTERVFGEETLPSPTESSEQEPIEEEEPAILIIEAVFADSGELVSIPVDLVSDDCGWIQRHSSGEIRLLVAAGSCSYRIESPAESRLKFSSAASEITLEPGQKLVHRLSVVVEKPDPTMGVVPMTWTRGSEWIEIVQGPVGLQPGDIVLEINGVAVSSLDDAALYELLAGPLSEPVSLVLAVAEGEVWTEVPVQIPRQAITF